MIGRYIQRTMSANGFIDRIFISRFKGGIEISIQQYLLIFMPICAHEGMQMHDSFSQSTGLVRTEYIHTTEVFNGGQTFDDDLLLCHTSSSMRQVDADY